MIATRTAPLTLDRAPLLSALQAGERIAPTKTTLEALKSLLLTVEEGHLTVTANDLEIGLALTVAEIDAEDWTALMPARQLAEYVGSLSSATVRLELDGRTLTVRGGASHAKLKGSSPDDFPRLRLATDWEVTLPSRVWREAIGKVVYAAASDETRPVLGGGYLKIEDTTLTLAAADGFRLAVWTVELVDAVAQPVSLLIPARALAHVAKLLPTTDDAAVTLGANPSGAVFRWEGGTLTTRLIEGQFPDYARIIPPAPTRTLILEAGQLGAAVKSALVLSRDNSDIVRLTADDDELLVQSTGAESGEQETRLTVSYQGDGEGKIAVNGRYLADALGTCYGTVELAWSEPTQPMRLRPLGGEGRLIVVIMPMRVV